MCVCASSTWTDHPRGRFTGGHDVKPILSVSLQLKSFHNELLTELEKKVELDARYLNVSLVIDI